MSRPVESCARGRDANQSTRAVSQSASQVRYRPNIVFIFKDLETASPPLNKPYPPRGRVQSLPPLPPYPPVPPPPGRPLPYPLSPPHPLYPPPGQSLDSHGIINRTIMVLYIG